MQPRADLQEAGARTPSARCGARAESMDRGVRRRPNFFSPRIRSHRPVPVRARGAVVAALLLLLASYARETETETG